MDRLLHHPKILERYKELIDLANEGMDHWTTVKHFKLVGDQLTIENGLLTPTLKIKRKKVYEQFGEVIESLYADAIST